MYFVYFFLFNIQNDFSYVLYTYINKIKVVPDLELELIINAVYVLFVMQRAGV